MDLGFPREVRLRQRAEFLEVQNQGRRFPGSHLILFVFQKGPGPTRFGVTVSRRVGGAVVRNRVKRRLREIIRLHRPLIPDGFDLVFIARASAATASSQRLAGDLARLARAAGMLKDGESGAAP